MGESKGSGFELGSSIPVLRMLDERASRQFYLDYLGYKVDWEHRFDADSPQSPLYMQIRLGQSVIHLNGHADENTPACEVRIPVVGLQKYCEHLRTKRSSGPQPEVVDPRYEGRNTDMNLLDPAQNHLVFWARDELQ